jgi:hypothetical protein
LETRDARIVNRMLRLAQRPSRSHASTRMGTVARIRVVRLLSEALVRRILTRDRRPAGTLNAVLASLGLMRRRGAASALHVRALEEAHLIDTPRSSSPPLASGVAATDFGPLTFGPFPGFSGLSGFSGFGGFGGLSFGGFSPVGGGHGYPG